MPKKHMFCADCGSQNLTAYYPTPEAVGRMVIEQAELLPKMNVLEPSAGTGELARLAVDAGAIVDCIELQPKFVERLEDSGLYRVVWGGDFLKRSPFADYHRVIMNPPFERGADMKHFEAALWYLKPGGIVVAVMGAMAGLRESRADKDFAALLERYNAKRTPLPRGSFKSVGTNVACDLIRVKLPERRDASS